MRSFQEAWEVAVYGADNQRILEITRIPRLFLPAPESPDQNLAVQEFDDGSGDGPVVDIPLSFVLTPLLKRLISIDPKIA